MRAAIIYSVQSVKNGNAYASEKSLNRFKDQIRQLTKRRITTPAEGS